MVSKIGAGAQSAPVLVKNSPSSYQGFDCPPNPCRWGDYAGAIAGPDPAGRDLARLADEPVRDQQPQPDRRLGLGHLELGGDPVSEAA